jgi:hypothetical protein
LLASCHAATPLFHTMSVGKSFPALANALSSAAATGPRLLPLML